MSEWINREELKGWIVEYGEPEAVIFRNPDEGYIDVVCFMGNIPDEADLFFIVPPWEVEQ